MSSKSLPCVRSHGTPGGQQSCAQWLASIFLVSPATGPACPLCPTSLLCEFLAVGRVARQRGLGNCPFPPLITDALFHLFPKPPVLSLLPAGGAAVVKQAPAFPCLFVSRPYLCHPSQILYIFSVLVLIVKQETKKFTDEAQLALCTPNSAFMTPVVLL